MLVKGKRVDVGLPTSSAQRLIDFARISDYRIMQEGADGKAIVASLGESVVVRIFTSSVRTLLTMLDLVLSDHRIMDEGADVQGMEIGQGRQD